MGKKLMQIFAGFTLGYLFIKWIPSKEAASLSDTLLTFVLNPLEFFAAALAFVGGVIMYGEVLKYVSLLLKSKKIQLEAGFIICVLFFSAGYLLQSALLLTIVFFSTAIIYGMIFLRN